MKTSTSIDERFASRDIIATYGKGRHAGALATASWLSARGLLVPPNEPWDVAIALDVVDERAPASFEEAADTRFHMAFAATEWGYFFCHHSRWSWIRVTDIPFVHERDDFGLRAKTPPLRDLGRLVRSLEEAYRVRFRRGYASIQTTIAGAEPAVRAWLIDEL